MTISITSTSPKTRLLHLDLLKLFAIFLVLWGHSTQYFFTSNFIEEPVFRVIYRVHMPLFIMISGYFAVNSIKKGFKDFLSGKVI